MAKAFRKQLERLQARQQLFDTMPNKLPPGYGTPAKEQRVYKRPGSMNPHKSHSIRKGRR